MGEQRNEARQGSPDPLDVGDHKHPHPISEFLRISARYRESIDAVREFTDIFASYARDYELIRAESKTTQASEVIQRFLDDADPGELAELEQLRGSNDNGERAPRNSALSSPAIAELLLRVMRIQHPHHRSHMELINRSALTILVSGFEVLISDLVHAYYRLHRGSLLGDEAGVHLSDLAEMDSIDDAFSFVAERHVDDLLRQDLDAWAKFFDSRIHVDMKLLSPSWEQWREQFQRRHIILHSGARITRRYLTKVSNNELGRLGLDSAEPGAPVEVDGTYLSSALDTFEVSGLLLCQAVWRKLVSSEHHVRHHGPPLEGLMDVVYAALLQERWYVAEHLAAWGQSDDSTEESDRMIHRLNCWLAIKRQGRWSAVQGEAAAVDASLLHPRFQIALFSLREEHERFFAVLPAALATNVTRESLREWPILQEMRSDPRFEDAAGTAPVEPTEAASGE